MFTLNEHDEKMCFMLAEVLQDGEQRGDRTGDCTISVFGNLQQRFDLRKGFPAVTAKYLHFHSVKHELKWMLSGDTNIRYMKDNKVRIWDEWIKEHTAEYRTLSHDERIAKLSDAAQMELAKNICNMEEDGLEEERIPTIEYTLTQYGIPEKELVAGDLGPVYGAQWRKWNDTRTIPFDEWYANSEVYLDQDFLEIGCCGDGYIIRRDIDQIALIERQLRDELAFQNGEIAKHVAGRRIVLSGWNVSYLEEMALPPCHTLAQWYVSSNKCPEGRNYVDCKLYMRSNDLALGMPFNIAQYALLTHMFAHVVGLTPRFYFHSIGDAHIYLKHQKGVREWLERPHHKAPILKIKGEYSTIDDIPMEAIQLSEYLHSGNIPMKVSV